MNFLAPAMLIGLAALAVPVWLHLINQRQVRTTDWAAMRFLRNQVQRHRNRLRLQDVLLLLLRCLLVSLTVLAFARPAWKILVPPGEQKGAGPVAVVVVLDHSASMGVYEGSQTRWEKAKLAVREWLKSLPAGSMAALHLVSDRTESLLARPVPDVGMVEGLLEKATLCERGTDLLKGIRLACETLSEVTGLPREVHVFTDGQWIGWGQDGELERLLEEYPEVRIVPHWVGDRDVGNLAVSEVRLEGGIAAEGQLCRVMVKVEHHRSSQHADAAQEVKVSLAMDGQTVATGMLEEIQPGEAKWVSLLVEMPKPGWHELTASIDADALLVDNRRSLAVAVVSKMEVLLVEEDHAGPAMDREGYFLANALVPTSREQSAQHYLGVQFVGPSMLAESLAVGNPQAQRPLAVFLCNVGTLAESALQALREYVNAGGSLIVFPGESVDLDEWRELQTFWEMLPAEMDELVESSTPRAWKGVGLTHPVTEFWNDDTHGSLTAVQFRMYFPLRAKSGARVVSELQDHTPAVVEWQFGEGHVVLSGSTATPEWTNLPLHPAFVPYLQRLLGYLNRSGSEARLNLSPGQVHRWTLDERWLGKRLRVRVPDGSEWGLPAVKREVNRLGPAKRKDEGEIVLRFGNTEKPGIYRLMGGEGEGELLGMFAVQPDPRESDLRRADLSKLEKKLASIRLAQSGSAKGLEKQKVVVWHEWWSWLIWIVAAMFVIEGVLAFWWTRKRDAATGEEASV